MTCYRRPAYTREVLDSLAACNGAEDYELCVSLDSEQCLEAVLEYPFERSYRVNTHRLGLNKNTHQALRMARNRKADAVIHIEDDTVLSSDALKYFAWGLNFMDGQENKIFSVSGYNNRNTPPHDEYRCRLRSWFTCWGWAMTRKNLLAALTNWCFKNPKSFAGHLNTRTRGKRKEVHPALSRIQNIGYEMGENNRTPEWYRKNHRSKFVAKDVPSGRFYIFP